MKNINLIKYTHQEEKILMDSYKKYADTEGITVAAQNALKELFLIDPTNKNNRALTGIANKLGRMTGRNKVKRKYVRKNPVKVSRNKDKPLVKEKILFGDEVVIVPVNENVTITVTKSYLAKILPDIIKPS